MNKEELKQKAEGYADSVDGYEITTYSISDIEQAYEKGALDFAEPRENKIAELEEQLAISEHDREHNDYELTEVYKKVADLEKENAEYKEVFGSCDTCKRSCDIGNCCDPRTKNGYLLDKVKAIVERQKLLKENAELKKESDFFHSEKGEYKGAFLKQVAKTNKVDKQLTKAKELLEDFICYANLDDCNLYIKEQAKQFLKDSEVEK